MYIFSYRDLTLHRNKWHCDCYLLELHNWLQNFTVPYLVEPKCHSPERLIGRDIKTTDDQEFACVPEVSPSSVYLEIIEGKNMSLVCSIKVRLSSLKTIKQLVVVVYKWVTLGYQHLKSACLA